MSEKLEAEVEAIKEGLAAIVTRLEEIAKAYTELPAEIKAEIVEPAATAGEVINITDKDEHTLGRMVVRQDEVVILPIETLQIKAIHPVVTRFLVPRILDPIKEKHGIEYTIGESEGLLKKIRLKGSGIRDRLNELKNPLAWAFERASARPAPALDLFPKDLAEMLEFDETDRWIIVRPRRYLGSANFAKIAAIVRDANGEYVSKGRESHFRIPRG